MEKSAESRILKQKGESTMKVCVFGASGYVGTSTYRMLEEIPGLDVSGTYLKTSPGLDHLKKLDINEPESFSAYYKQENPDVVVWAVMSGPNEHELTDQGLMHLITHLTPETKLVYISSDFVFSNGKGPYKEDDPISALPEDHIFSNYTNGKVKAERLIKNELDNYVILRAGPVYGRNQIGEMDELTDRLASHLRIDQPAFYRDDLVRSFVHVEELAKTVIEMIQNKAAGIFHVGEKEPKSYYEFMQKQAEQMGYPAELIKKESTFEDADKEIPKDTSLITKKITAFMKQKYN
jgi:dTDP-4-dehydrorhamnose reductase